jgi:hypothetical protein
MPVTQERWANIANTYNDVCKLPNGLFFAAMGGTGGVIAADHTITSTDPVTIGSALSVDGRQWVYNINNPILGSGDGTPGAEQTHRAQFTGYCGNGTYLIGWTSADNDPALNQPRVGYTTDFQAITDKHCPLTSGSVFIDGTPVTAWREGDKLYLIGGRHIYEFQINGLS